MVEIKFGAPVLLGMATVARRVEMLPVRAGRAMAGIAVGTQLLRGYACGMADVAFEFRVNPHQGEFGLREMVVLNRMPHVVAVAIVAPGAKAPRMRVVGAVASIAILGNLCLVDAAAMATEAVNLLVHAK